MLTIVFGVGVISIVNLCCGKRVHFVHPTYLRLGWTLFQAGSLGMWENERKNTKQNKTKQSKTMNEKQFNKIRSRNEKYKILAKRLLQVW